METEVTGATAEQALIDTIIADAVADAEKIALSAQYYYDQTVSNATEEADKYLSMQAETAAKKAEDVIKRGQTLASLEARKTLLAARQALVEEVFSRVGKMLESMGKAEYSGFIDKLISAHAEKGDKIILSVNAPISASEAENLPSAKKLGLKAEKTGEFGGGIVLSGDKFDKDLTFAAVCAALKEKYEAEIALKLFG